jgi:hypothetical protein
MSALSHHWRDLGRRLVPLIGLACVFAVVLTTPVHAHHEPFAGFLGGPLTDDPSGHEDPAAGANGAGNATVKGAQAVRAQAEIPRVARNITLLGALKLEPFNAGVHGDVAGFRNLAFVGKWREQCPGTGVDVIDVSNPRAPRKVGDTVDHPNTSMEDMEAMRIGSRDVLAVGLQDCGTEGAEPGVAGLELHDVSDPAEPRVLSVFGTDAGGVHELDIARTRDGRVLALLAVPNQEILTADELGIGGAGDTLIVDITNPTRPRLLSDFGVIDEPQLGLDAYLAGLGVDARVYGHSVRANQDATLAYVSYWDAGVQIVDISDPRNPVFLGRTQFAPDDEGNAHSVDEAREGDVLVQADEDFSPFRPTFTSNAFPGEGIAIEAEFTPPLAELPGRELAGDVVHVGRGCPAGAVAPGAPADEYLGDPRGKVALIERGACRFDHKIARAQGAGAIGVLVYNNAEGGDELVLMAGDDPVTLPDGAVVDITIQAFFVTRSTGLLLRDAAAPTVRLALEFDGWGYLRFFDIKDPSDPQAIAQFATPNTNNEAVATDGVWSVHNPEVRGNRLYASWYSDGIRLLNISAPSAPREVGYWTGAGAPADAPPVDIWSVVPHRDVLLASDRNYGLYVLRDDYLRSRP